MRRLHDALQVKFSRKVPLKTVRLIDPRVDESAVLGALLPFLGAQYQARPVLFHLDVTSSVGVLGFRLRGHMGTDATPPPCPPSPQRKWCLHSVWTSRLGVSGNTIGRSLGLGGRVGFRVSIANPCDSVFR